MVTIPFDSRGPLVALAYFLGVFLILAVIFVINLRHERLGRFELSRRTRIVGFSALSLAYVAVLYGWLYWRTFYEVRVDPGAGLLELRVLMPERRLRWPLERITSIRQAPGNQPGRARLIVETDDGRRYKSPDRRTAEITAALRQLESVLKL
jgi:hypothetical protein